MKFDLSEKILGKREDSDLLYVINIKEFIKKDEENIRNLRMGYVGKNILRERINYWERN